VFPHPPPSGSDEPVTLSPRCPVVTDSTRHLQPYFHAELSTIFGELYPISGASIEYLSQMLARYCHTSQLFRRNRQGQPMVVLTDMLIEAQGFRGDDESGEYRPFEEVRLVRHMGDYALFMVSLFKEFVERRGSPRWYIQIGRQAYRQVADFEAALDRRRAEVFAELGESFELCAVGLSHLRRTPRWGAEGGGEICLSNPAW
jgi:hypothetical protein